jgi:hypothetical protein
MKTNEEIAAILTVRMFINAFLPHGISLTNLKNIEIYEDPALIRHMQQGFYGYCNAENHEFGVAISWSRREKIYVSQIKELIRHRYVLPLLKGELNLEELKLEEEDNSDIFGSGLEGHYEAYTEEQLKL